jgi:hypothetical protein
MHPIGLHLPFNFSEDNFPTKVLPTIGRGKLRAQSAEKEEGNALTQEVGIGRKVGRKIAPNVPGVKSQGPEQIVPEMRR